jgi:outer membrane protein OmpA-like peptidoglycan-associated protein
MKTLVTGFLIFVCWASLATWIYVCKIKGLCNEKEAIAFSASLEGDTSMSDSLLITPEMEPVAPGILLVYFEFDKSTFVIDSLLSVFSDASISYTNSHTESSLIIIGHTDAIGSGDYNLDLGYRRAQSIKDYFVREGMADGKITIVSKGENEPADDNSTDEGRAKNRRASISIITNK